MADTGKSGLVSVEGAVGLLVAVVAAAGDMNWYLRTGLVIFGLVLIAHLAWRIPRKGMAAIIFKAFAAAVFSAGLIAITWHPIWEDFHQKYPLVTAGSAAEWLKEKWYGPPPPPPPWVTQDEIDEQQKQGRILLNFSPTELMTMWQHGQNIGLYLSKWIKTEIKFSAPTPQIVNKKKFLVIEMQIPGLLFTQAFLTAYFDQEKWEAKLVPLRPGDTIKALCQFDRIDRKEQKTQYQGQPFTWNIDHLIAYNCDLL